MHHIVLDRENGIYKAGINAFPDAIDYHLKCVSTPFKAR
jgi:hypothetical protein